MSAVVIVGTQWGDEGKGKITDYLAEQADVIVRYQGGSNAGHTVVVDDHEFKLQLLPSGILHPDKLCIIGNGVVIDLEVLTREIANLRAQGYLVKNLRLSDRAHIVLPYHRLLDEMEETARGDLQIGTTRRGIGPAYADKSARIGLRMCDLRHPERLDERLGRALEQKNRLLFGVYGHDELNFAEIREQLLCLGSELLEFVTDTTVVLDDAIRDNRNVLFEGAQGTLLDLDFGTYPYVTSSHPIAGGACIGAGVGPTRIDSVLGVAKAYVSRVGDGPFPTEQSDGVGDWLRERGNEFGTTTGRPRRCGWLDIVLLRHAVRVSGIDALVITRLDVLSGLEELRVCTNYISRGNEVADLPADLDTLAECSPSYVTVPGWKEDLGSARRIEDLPKAARSYVELIERLCGVPASLISVGRERQQTIARRPVF